MLHRLCGIGKLPTGPGVLACPCLICDSSWEGQLRARRRRRAGPHSERFAWAATGALQRLLSQPHSEPPSLFSVSPQGPGGAGGLYCSAVRDWAWDRRAWAGIWPLPCKLPPSVCLEPCHSAPPLRSTP